ncbi:extensin family protein [Brucella sp. IR073]|uniref:extensin-like domain-containing protein n=1 Tax=unclassified Brucella TaxID=2632610 RepID=UPI003B986049
MSITLSPQPHRLATLFIICATVFMASCSRETVRRPEADVGMSLAAPAENDQSYGFQSRLENPVTAGENLYAQSSSEMACRVRLKQLGVVFTDLPPINDGGACRIDNPILVSGFAGGNIRFQPAAKLNCQVTEAFARWVKGDLVPSTRFRYLSGVNTIYNAGGYSCRTMNHRRGAKMSEHSRGNAIDVTRIRLNNGDLIKVEKPGWFSFRKRGLLNSVRSEACDYFTTVLGPGYNREHADHFHFDLMQRRNGYRACK